MMPHWTQDLIMLTRLTRDFPSFVRQPLTEAQAVKIVQCRLEKREERFLTMAKQAIYGSPQSPYLHLLRAAGCEFDDLRALVTKEGLEGTLSQLAGAGVYVTVDEFKGRAEAVRGSQRFAFAEEAFDNPRLSPHFALRSGGTRSPGTTVKVGLSYIADLAASMALALHAQGLSRHGHALWILSTGALFALRLAKLGRAPTCWFYPFRALTFRLQVWPRYLALLGRLSGCPLPVPATLDLSETDRITSWLADRVRQGTPMCLLSYASSAVRISATAKERGIPLQGVCFIVTGEPFTEAKQRIVEAAGARAVVHYGLTEAGLVGSGCGNPQFPDDVHVSSDCYGLIRRSREVGDTGFRVPAFLLSSLLPSAPKILLNVESGDYGVSERRGCGCRLEAVGLKEHLLRIRSFEKLSSEGMTFVQSDLLQILETILPARFGGAGTDYQVLEEEGEDGLLRLFLLVSPRVGSINEAEVCRTFLQELGRDGGAVQIGAGIWERAETVTVQRRWPIATKAGKILPFHLIKHGQTTS